MALCNAVRYTEPMITSFRCADTESIFHGDRVSSFQVSVQKVARRKLRMLDAAQELNDLRVPPANRLEKLKGNRAGQHSIRVNNQYRICFVWNAGKASRVEIVDYH